MENQNAKIICFGIALIVLIITAGMVNAETNANVTELAVNNNMKGDYDGDRDIDFYDFVEFAAAYNKVKGDSGYDDIFDFDEDNDVDFYDFVEFAGVYGTSLDDKVRIGAFNIQIFGVTKADNTEVMNIIADIIRTYDIIAIQEIRDISQTALPELVDLVNSDGSQYDYVVSERLGRTISKEQYAYIYDTSTIELTGEAHTYPEPEGTDPFHRQPYIMSYQTIGGNYDAVLMVIHTDPDEATEEINSLADVVEYAKIVYPGEQDFVIMGDFNADGNYFDEDSTSDISGSEYTWVIDNSQDTTVASSSNTYDRIVLTDTSDYIDSGVFRFDTEYGLSLSEASAVSDHYPVYVDFQIDQDNDASSPSVYIPIDEQGPSEYVQIVGLSLIDEWIKIKNTAQFPISLTEWTIVDEGDKHTYTFPSFTLAASTVVTVHTGYGTDTATDLYWGSGNYIWNNDGDYARLYDSDGNLVDTRIG